MKNYNLMRGDSPRAREASEIVNEIIYHMRRSGNRVPGAVLYLGQRQKWALRMVEPHDPYAMRDDTFVGWPIVWVERESYMRLSA